MAIAAFSSGRWSEISGVAERRVAAFARNPASQGFAALYGKARLPQAFLPAFRAALAGVEAAGLGRGDTVSRALTERVIEACESSGDPRLAPMQSLLWRLAAEAAREDAREFAEDAARTDSVRLIAAPREAPDYEPLLIEAVAAALEDFDAPAVEAPCDPPDDEFEAWSWRRRCNCLRTCWPRSPTRREGEGRPATGQFEVHATSTPA